MGHSTPLITLLVAGIGLAFVLGTLANRLRISPLIGYLLAGVMVGPFTPGFVASTELASQLAEIGVILLMFGVGLHFSLSDLISVRAVAVPGALLQIVATTVLGIGLAWGLGWKIGTGAVFGLSLSIASTVVLLRGLQERRLMDTDVGRVAIGWLVIQDLLTVVALVLLPPLSGLLRDTPGAGPLDPAALAVTIAITLGKVAAFIALMLIVGRRVIPALLHYVAHTGSRELFRLAVLAVALGVAFGAAELFGVSFALGAFFAGMVLSESQLSQRAAEETLPLRDAFAVLFFISVGMLFNPSVLLREPMALLGTCLVILLGNAGATIVLIRLFGPKTLAGLTIAAGLAQIGEFSFILADIGVRLELLPPMARDLILGASILTIFFNPVLFFLVARWTALHSPASASPDLANSASPRPASTGRRAPKLPVLPAIPRTSLTGHAVIVGFGRVGRLVGEGLRQEGWPVLVIEEGREDTLAKTGGILPGEFWGGAGIELIHANGALPEVLRAANLGEARILFVAIPSVFEAGQIVEQARAIRPELEIIARAHQDAEVAHLMAHGADIVVMGEREIARTMLEHAQTRRNPLAMS